MNAKYINRIFLVTLLLFAGVSSQAEVKLPKLVSDGMVLQREKPLNIWGWADPSEAVKVSFKGKTYKTKANAEGQWSVTLPSQQAGGPYSMTINHIQLNDILIGDVWLCSGQSNMELPVRRVMEKYREEIEKDDNPNIRQFKVPMTYNFEQPQTDYKYGSWTKAQKESILDFSAVAYFFAKDLYAKYGVPVGLINSAVGGSPAEAWVSKEGLAQFPYFINEAEKCANDEYRNKTTQSENEARNNWVTTLNANDAGTALWNKENTDDSAWGTITLPGFWEDKGVAPLNGSIWFRKHFEITDNTNLEDAVLRLGCIVDCDSVFVNGTFVGTTSYMYPPRIYNVPKEILRKGSNNVTIRLISYSGKGGLVEDKPYSLTIGRQRIPLAGEWKYKIGAEMPALGSTTFFQYKPIGLYNGMIAPMRNYAVKGVIWYQGESNVGRNKEYEKLFPALISDWRNKLNDPQLPFLYVQLPSFLKATYSPAESGWAELRNVQTAALKLPGTAMAVVTDVGEWNDIHPLNKKTVGHRLSLAAQNIAYGDTQVCYSGPAIKSISINGSKAILTFNTFGDSLKAEDKLRGFAICGADGKYVWAQARIISPDTVEVWADNVASPASVRYAWSDNALSANLFNSQGLPAIPFEIK
ncbi:sialate O-acetylesterase [Dysgonomonas macrotermitis]|uniref:Sialate O-acetylesterase n=1 Tax=Dysgonomonas macrotermitis TaxID=1346286 RepID=A0A1M4SKJ8_9BACT|nr:sialate O-acetylesterase [Dysgonomonas macrotermitis]SHE32730.1 sialate O-acetylesterase [Dysgonomonas macrotermitis]